MKESRFDTFKSRYEPYKKIYDMNKKYEKFANWFFEKRLLGYSYTHKLKEVFNDGGDRLHNTYEASQVTGRKLDFQGDRVREGFKGRVPAGNGVTGRKLDFQGDRVREGFNW